jgi:ATP/maltotriose-dependent transcriptional regulator MalT
VVSQAGCTLFIKQGKPWFEKITDTRFCVVDLAFREILDGFEASPRLVAEGQTNRQIGRRLNLSEHTVKNYLYRVFEKVGVRS